MDYVDKKTITDFFNDGGYVLDFNDYTFSEFTTSVIGKDLKINGLSKGKSLNQFIMHDGTDSEIIKLSKNMIKYYHNIYVPNDPFDQKDPSKVEEVINKYDSRTNINSIKSTNYFDDNDNNILNGKSFIINLINNNPNLINLVNNSEVHFKDTQEYSHYYPKGLSGWNQIGLIVGIVSDSETMNNWKKIGDNLIPIFQAALDFNSKYDVVDVQYFVNNDLNTDIDMSKSLSERIKSISTRDAWFIDMDVDEKIEIINNTIENILNKNGSFIEINESNYFGFITNDNIKAYRKMTQCFRHATDKSINERKSFTKDQKQFLIEYGITILKTLDKFEKLV
ncbi:hypothetical protein ACYATO_08695 [Lactobacillaceae bacterium Melli_B3]